jgi:NADH-quinone oxidoreductase subunit J
MASKTTSKVVRRIVGTGLVLAFLAFLGTKVLLPPDPASASAHWMVRLQDILFYGFAALTIGGAGFVAFSRNIIHTAIGLLGSLIGVGCLYVFLSADFVAVTQLLVYIGGVLVLILFAVMLTSRIGDVNVSNTSFGRGGGFALLATFVPLLWFVAARAPWDEKVPGPLAPTTAAIGNEFLTRWVLPFELASIVLLATLIGAVVMARREIRTDADTE